MAVVAFDDFDWAEMMNPPVSVVDQDIVAIGRAAGGFLLRQLRAESVDPAAGEQLVLKPSLRIRQSCGCGRVHGLARDARKLAKIS